LAAKFSTDAIHLPLERDPLGVLHSDPFEPNTFSRGLALRLDEPSESDLEQLILSPNKFHFDATHLPSSSHDCITTLSPSQPGLSLIPEDLTQDLVNLDESPLLVLDFNLVPHEDECDYTTFIFHERGVHFFYVGDCLPILISLTGSSRFFYNLLYTKLDVFSCLREKHYGLFIPQPRFPSIDPGYLPASRQERLHVGREFQRIITLGAAPVDRSLVGPSQDQHKTFNHGVEQNSELDSLLQQVDASYKQKQLQLQP
jgi:hypothetical protein